MERRDVAQLETSRLAPREELPDGPPVRRPRPRVRDPPREEFQIPPHRRRLRVDDRLRQDDLPSPARHDRRLRSRRHQSLRRHFRHHRQVHGVDQVGEVAAEAVELPDDEHVALPQGAQAAVESRPVLADAAGEVVVEVDRVVDACGPQGVRAAGPATGSRPPSRRGRSRSHVSQTTVWDMRVAGRRADSWLRPPVIEVTAGPRRVHPAACPPPTPAFRSQCVRSRRR